MGDQELKEKTELFLLACARGLLTDVEALIADGIAPSTVDRAKHTGAHFAAGRGEVEVLQLLHAKGVDLDADDASGRSPLHYAAAGNHERAVTFLLSKGCWLDATDEAEDTPLHLAAAWRSPEAISRLLKAGAKAHLPNELGMRPIDEAICSGHVASCVALRRGNAATELDRTIGGRAPIHMAAALGKVATATWLLDQDGVSVSGVTADGESLSVLQCAVLGGSAELVQKLVAAGAATSHRNAKGETAAELVDTAEMPDNAPSNQHERLRAALAGKPLPAAAPALTRRDAPAETPAAAPQLQARSLASKEITPAAPQARSQNGLRKRRAAAAQLSPAAMLKQARTADEIAAVLAHMPEDHQRLRVRMWSELSAEELRAVEGLTAEACRSIEKVQQLRWFVTRKTALDSLRQDAQFQELMHDKQVRSIVDAVIADPHNIERVRSKDAMYCLSKMKQLRDVNKAHGGDAINLDEALSAWNDEEAARSKAMHTMLDESIAEAISTICGSVRQGSTTCDTAVDDGLLDVADNGGSSNHQARRQLIDRDNGDIAQDASTRRWWQVWKGEGIVAEVVRRLSVQCAVLAFMAVVLWWRDMLPSQIKQRMAAAVSDGTAAALDTESVHEGLIN